MKYSLTDSQKLNHLPLGNGCGRTEVLHIPGSSDKQSKLFIPWVKPHRSMIPSSIARWLKTVLDVAGIDTTIFKAHSTRGAAVSAAKNLGVTRLRKS